MLRFMHVKAAIIENEIKSHRGEEDGNNISTGDRTLTMLPTRAGNRVSMASARNSGPQRDLSDDVWWSRGSSDETNQRLRFSDSRRLAFELVVRRGPPGAEDDASPSDVLSAFWELQRTGRNIGHS